MKSELCVYELSSGDVTVVLETDRLIEAPHWTPDAVCMIVNCEGRLFNVDLTAPDLDEVNTDFAVTCNNDHGISPDGKTLVISDRTEDGASAIYTLPAGGGRPTRVTTNSPSYWHGWSPNGRELAYVGRRDGGPFNVYTIPVEGGEETRLTSGFDHTDGPDYSPDGRWIWFNGEKDGEMQLWRMQTDGSKQRQMTDDERWNWFPHPSPDGRHVVYVSYEPGTKGHPRDCDVQLRMMASDGGEPQVLLDIFGGQGSMNVPSWAPDGSRFAFVRYAKPE